MQDIYGTETTNRPVLENAKTSDTMKPMSEIPTLIEDMDYIKEHKTEIVDRFKDIFASIN